jgi:hypothetical protein
MNNEKLEAGLASDLNRELDTVKQNCNWFNGHKWEKWHELSRGNMVANKTNTVGFWIKQERVCSNCGLKQLRVDSV